MNAKDKSSNPDTLCMAIQTQKWPHKFAGWLLFLLLAIFGLQACATANVPQSDQTTIPPKLEQVIEDYITAYNEYDTEAFQAVITDGYMLYEGDSYSTSNVSNPVCNGFDAEEMSTYIEGYNMRRVYQFELIGEPIVTGDGPWIVSQVIHVSAIDYPSGLSGISTFTIVDEGGIFKVTRDVFVGFKHE
ncbi:MAG: hypothetical protein ACK2UP_05660 [Candidatus Promineifilaceae bacterium]